MKVECLCGKLLCKYRNGNLFLYCKVCKKEIKVPIKEILEPKSQD